MSRSDILQIVKKILERFTQEKHPNIEEDTILSTDLGLNSSDVVNIVVAFEDEFDIEIPDSDIKNMQSVKDILDYMENQEI